MKRRNMLNLSVGKAVAILEYLAEAKSPKDLGVISSDLDMSKSTVYRFLSTLMTLGYACQDPETGRYSLGARTAWLGMKYLEGVEIRDVARPLLKGLAETTGETIHLGILDGSEVVYIDKFPSQHPVEMKSRVGGRVLIYSTALGKVLLASRPESEWHKYLEEVKLEPRTPKTITDNDEFVDLLRGVQVNGYAVDDCENEEDIRCIAAPVYAHTGEVIAAVSASGSTISMTPKKAKEITSDVREAALALSEVLGFDPAS